MRIALNFYDPSKMRRNAEMNKRIFGECSAWIKWNFVSFCGRENKTKIENFASGVLQMGKGFLWGNFVKSKVDWVAVKLNCCYWVVSLLFCEALLYQAFFIILWTNCLNFVENFNFQKKLKMDFYLISSFHVLLSNQVYDDHHEWINRICDLRKIFK